MTRCVCGCGRRAPHRHHVVSQGEIRKKLRARKKMTREQRQHLVETTADRRNIVMMAFDCHFRHHYVPGGKLALDLLPDSVFEFAVELLGAGPAYEYMRRYYAGEDPRLDAVLGDGDAAA